MAYTITETQAAELLKIADAIVGPYVKKGFIQPSQKDDYIQELMLVLVKTQDTDVIPPGVSLTTFATEIMKKRIFSIMRKYKAKKNVLNSAISLNQLQKNEDGEDEELIDQLSSEGLFCSPIVALQNESMNELKLDMAFFLETLEPLEREICKMRMHAPIRAIAAELNMRYTQVYRILKGIHKKLLIQKLRD